MQPIFISCDFSGHNCPPNHRICSDQTSLGFAGNPATLQEEKFSDTIFWVETVPLPEAGPKMSELMVKIWGPKMGKSPKSSR